MNTFCNYLIGKIKLKKVNKAKNRKENIFFHVKTLKIICIPTSMDKKIYKLII